MELDPQKVALVGLEVYALKKLLGPSAEYLGGEIKDGIAKAQANLGRIFQAAVRTLGDRINDSGAVSPRVLNRICQEGAFVENALAAEYLGGLLASSRHPGGDDDRSLPFFAVIRDMSAYDIHLHYIIYSAMRSAWMPSPSSADNTASTYRRGVFIREDDLAAAMMLAGHPEAKRAVVEECVMNLSRLDLVKHPTTKFGGPEILYRLLEGNNERGLVAAVSDFGTQLYYRVHGITDRGPAGFFEPNAVLDRPAAAIVPAAQAVNLKLHLIAG